MPSAAALDLTNTPHAAVRPVPPAHVRLAPGSFWDQRLRAVQVNGLPSQLRHCQTTGRIRNFERAAGQLQGEFEGYYFNDSDVYKWLEAASYALARAPSAELRQAVERVVQAVRAAQDADGYVNTYFSGPRADQRYRNLRDEHELYCMGHLVQAGIAHRRSLGSDELFDVAVRAADHVCAVFGPQGRPEPDGHPEIEMALVELARETGQRRYLDMALFFVDQRGADPPRLGGLGYHQDHRPVRQQTEATGHAVRQAYLAAGMTDAAMETGDAELLAASQSLWDSAYRRRAYVTGGLGSRYEGESFGADYELPNRRAYAETCAAVAGVLWNARLLAATGHARYADWLETTLYNGALAGVSLDGAAYFYANPLAADPRPAPGDQRGLHSSGAQQAVGAHARQPWYACACCPPNIARLLLSMTGYAYGTSSGGVWVHQFLPGEVEACLPDGQALRLQVETDYPWDGTVRLTIQDAPAQPLTLHLRVPAWAAGASYRIEREGNAGRPVAAAAGAYVRPRRVWRPGTVVHVTLPMPARLIGSHPRVQANTGRAALARGPLIYCLESLDHPGVDVDRLALLPTERLRPVPAPDLPGGLTALTGTAAVLEQRRASNDLYAPLDARPPRAAGDAPLTAIPYFAWANRGASAMRVWLPYLAG